MSEPEPEQKNNPDVETPSPPPKEDTKPATKNNLLDVLEKDFIDALKGKVELADFAGYDQETRIKIMRNLKNTLDKFEPAKSNEPDANKVKGKAKDPTNAPPDVGADQPLTFLELNNLKDFRNDIRKKDSVMQSIQKRKSGK